MGVSNNNLVTAVNILDSELQRKEDAIPFGKTSQYWNGGKEWVDVFTFTGSLDADVPTGGTIAPVSATGLVFDYRADSTYEISIHALVEPGLANTGCGFQFDLSSAVTSVSVQFYHQLDNLGAISGGYSVADDVSAVVSSGMPGISTYPVIVSGLIRTSSESGTAQLRFRSGTTTIVTLKAGTTMKVTKIG